MAVLAGDFMFAQSSWFLANLENIEVIKLISQVRYYLLLFFLHLFLFTQVDTRKTVISNQISIGKKKNPGIPDQYLMSQVFFGTKNHSLHTSCFALSVKYPHQFVIDLNLISYKDIKILCNSLK